MVQGERRRRSVTEDEMVLADLEGDRAARATVDYGRERRRRTGQQRWGQLQRIAEVHGLGELDAFDDIRVRVLHEVIGYVDEHVWRDTLADVRRHVLEDEEGDGWFPELAERRRIRESLEPEPDHPSVTPRQVDEDAVFEPDGHAISRMTLERKQAIERAAMHLAGEGSSMVVDEDYVCPNPYQDLWIVGYTNPRHPGELLAGGGPIIVPVDGKPYELDSLPGRPREYLGAILPPDDEWD